MPKKLKQPLTIKFDEALQLASGLHRKQARKGTQVPYISHLLAVSALVLEYGGTEAQAIAGLLHDAVEDCGGEPVLAKIKRRFGPDVAGIVAACTDSFEVGRKRDWRERKVAYLEHLQDSNKASLLVVAADKLHNLLSIQRDFLRVGDGLWLRFKAGPDDQVWYYESIVKVLEKRLDNPIVFNLTKTFENVRGLLKRERK
jgi:(p)ppGpp synthase/HD superfamily hydrolase